jgi:hypothetical protein
MLPKLKLVTFSCLKNSKNRVGILLENKSVIDLTSVSPKPVYYDMLKLIDGGKDTINETKSFAKNPPSSAIVDEKSVVLKAPIPLPRFMHDLHPIHDFLITLESRDRKWFIEALNSRMCDLINFPFIFIGGMCFASGRTT